MDGATGRRRAELPEYVMTNALNAEITALIGDLSGQTPTQVDQDDVFFGNGLHGDDGDDLFYEIMQTYRVNLDGARPEFHYLVDEPPRYRRVLPIDAQGRIIPFMPVTVEVIAQAVNDGRWPITYPEHTIKTVFSYRRNLLRACLVIATIIAISLYLKTPL